MIFTASSHITDWSPSFGFQWNFTNVERFSAFTKRNVWTPKPSMNRKDRGIARSDIAHISMWVDSGIKRHEVPEVVVRGLRLRKGPIRFLLRGMDEVGKLDRVLDEEHGNVVADDVEVSRLRVQLHRKSAHITRQIERTLVSDDGGEPDKRRGDLTRLLEEICSR